MYIIINKKKNIIINLKVKFEINLRYIKLIQKIPKVLNFSKSVITLFKVLQDRFLLIVFQMQKLRLNDSLKLST